MNKYRVEAKQKGCYEIEANNEDEAIERAWDSFAESQPDFVVEKLSSEEKMIELDNAEKGILEKILNKVKEENTILSGKYDAKNGNEDFMDGISTAMEFFAYLISEQYGDIFVNRFYQNMEDSERKAGKRND